MLTRTAEVCYERILGDHLEVKISTRMYVNFSVLVRPDMLNFADEVASAIPRRMLHALGIEVHSTVNVRAFP